MLNMCGSCGLAGEIVRRKPGDIDSAQMIIRIVQSMGRKDRHVMLPEEVLSLLQQWWKVCPTRYDANVLRGEGRQGERGRRWGTTATPFQANSP
jgi:integrase